MNEIYFFLAHGDSASQLQKKLTGFVVAYVPKVKPQDFHFTVATITEEELATLMKKNDIREMKWYSKKAKKKVYGNFTEDYKVKDLPKLLNKLRSKK